ncbi:MAG: hypothetical protein A2173_06300 [Planctomycetes bacterium RBG_13_44_8b]|nr:MAG: hypothetical protein A2173_06300 [Planctomycetes bacterium RBG_13_44_8b]
MAGKIPFSRQNPDIEGLIALPNPYILCYRYSIAAEYLYLTNMDIDIAETKTLKKFTVFLRCFRQIS